MWNIWSIYLSARTTRTTRNIYSSVYLLHSTVVPFNSNFNAEYAVESCYVVRRLSLTKMSCDVSNAFSLNQPVMFGIIGNSGQWFSLIRRLCFAAKHLPEEIPRYWEQVVSFADSACSSHFSDSLTEKAFTAKDARLCVENLMELDAGVFQNDTTLFKEMCQRSTRANNPLGCVLISQNNTCKVCGGRLLLKARDSIRKIVVYDEVHGTYIGCHYVKFCKNITCKFRQYYGKYTTDGVELYYDPDWMENDFFLSTQQTAFSMRLIKNFDTEFLIGQISYNQKTNIYNTIHSYNGKLMKTRSAANEENRPKFDTEEEDLGPDKGWVWNRLSGLSVTAAFIKVNLLRHSMLGKQTRLIWNSIKY